MVSDKFCSDSNCEFNKFDRLLYSIYIRTKSIHGKLFKLKDIS